MASFTFFRLIGENLQKHATTLNKQQLGSFLYRANLEKAAATRES